MEITEKQKSDLEETIKDLESRRGRHTQLVSVMISAGFNVSQVTRQLEAEKSTAANIKSKQTRNSVTDALERIIRELKGYKQTPPNGLALFSGNVSEQEGVQDVKLWVIEPPRPLNVRMYRCDQTFIVEPLKEMLETQQVYGLLVIDRQEATMGVLEGRKIKVLSRLTSGVPGKVRAGGQCLSPDTLIMKDDGDLIEIKDSHNPLIILSENFNSEKTEKTPIVAKWENEKELYRVTTSYPRFELKASKEHTLFVRTEKGIEEKELSEIKEGDYLLLPEKIDVLGEEQAIDFKPKILQAFNMKEIKIPKTITTEFARILGYYLGDGNHEIDRICFSESRIEVAEYYAKSIKDCFGIEATVKFRGKKGYYQTRVGSRILAQLFKQIYPERNKTLEQSIPSIVLKSPNKVLESFIAGLFDAEGYVSKSRVALGINNKLLAKQLQFALLRLGIISSINEYDNRRNPYSKNIRYTIAIDDLESLKKFEKNMGFISQEKQSKIREFIEKRSNRNKVRQLVVNGREIAKIIRNSSLNTRQFNCPDFFNNKKQLSKEIFKKNIIDKIQDNELKRRLELFYLSNLIIAKIRKIEPCGVAKTIDIETKNHNFLANGLIVHNSSQRFHRITEGLAKEFFRRVSGEMKKLFFEMPKLKGILVGGPIPTKEEFLEEGELVTKLKELVIAVKDIGYVDEHGLELLVEASEEDIQEQELIKEKKIVENFFEILGKNPEKTTYGEEKVTIALNRGAVEKLLISKDFPKDKAKELEAKATSMGSEILIVSKETKEGEQFFNITKGVGAILRFAFQ